MKSIVVPTMGSLPGFSRTESGSEIYWTERLNYEGSKAFNLMNAQGFTIQQPELEDVDAINTWIASTHASLTAYITSFVAWVSEGGDYPEEPSLPTLPDNYDFFHTVVLEVIKSWYDSLRFLRGKQVEKIFADLLRDGFNEVAETENIVNIGDHACWCKSLSVDEI